MRDATKEERESVNRYVEKISEPVFAKAILIKIANAISEKCGKDCCPCKIGCEVYTGEECIKRIIDWLESVIQDSDNVCV